MSDLSKINFGGTEYNIKDTTARTDVAKKVTASGGDISNTKIVTADNITTEFPVPAANDTAKGFLGKMKKFCTDFNNFKSGIITLGKLVNNGQCTEPGFALDARYGKALYDLFAQLNRDLNKKVVAFSATVGQDAGSISYYILPPSGIVPSDYYFSITPINDNPYIVSRIWTSADRINMFVIGRTGGSVITAEDVVKNKVSFQVIGVHK